MARIPPGISTLKPGTTAGTICDEPVSLLNLYPTLVEIVGPSARADNDGPSLLPLFRDPSADWPHVAVSYLNRPGAFSVSNNAWRYIHYANGDEELYNIEKVLYE